MDFDLSRVAQLRFNRGRNGTGEGVGSKFCQVSGIYYHANLATSGDGMIASLAGGFLRPRFAEMEKRVLSLAAFSVAGVKLHGVRISGGNSLRIEAQFGG